MSQSSGSFSDFENPARYDYGSDFEIESDDSTEYDNLRRRLARDDITDDIDDVITARDDDDDDLSDVDVLAELAGRGSGSSDNNNEAGQDDVTSNVTDDNHDGSDTSGLGTTYTITDDRSPVVLLGDSSNASPINGAFIFPPESGAADDSFIFPPESRAADDSFIFPPESRAADDSSGLRAGEDRMSRLVPSPPRSPRDRRDYREYSPRRYRVRSPDSRSSTPAGGLEETASPGPVSPVSPEITHRPRRPVPDQPFVTSGYLSHFVLDTVPTWRENSQSDTDSSFLGNYSWRANSPTNWRQGTNLSPDTTSLPLDSSDTSSNNRQIHRLSISDVVNNGSDVTSEGGSHEPGEVATVPCLICDSDSNSGSDWDVSYNDVIPPDNADHDNVTNVETFTDVTPLGDTLADVDDLQQTLADDATDSPFDVILRSSVDAGASDNEEPDSHVPNILLPSEAPDDDVTYSDDVMIVAQMIDLANSLELPNSGRDAPLMEMSGGEGIDTEQNGDLESHTERRLRLIRQAASDSGPGERGDADGGDDVDEESTPIPASRSRRQGWAGGAETNTLLRDTSLEFGGNAEEQTTLTMMSRLAAQLQPLTPTVVSSNTSAAAPPCPQSDPDEHITFEQLMNMDSTALGELADDERGDLELDEFVAQWAGDERDLLFSLMSPPTPPRRRVDSPEPEITPSLTGILRRRGGSPEPDVSYTRTGRSGIFVPRVRGGSPEAHIRRRRRGSMDRHTARRSPVSSVSPVSSLDSSDTDDDLRDLLTPAALERRRAASAPSPDPDISHRRSMDRDFNRRGSVERHVADRGTPENYLACISRMRADSPETPPRPRYTGSVDRDLNLERHVADRSGILVPRVRGGSPEAHIRRRRGSMDRDLNRRGSLERHRADSLEVIADRASPETSARPRVNPASYQRHIATRGHHLTDSESEDDEMEGNRPGSMGEEEWRQVMDVIRADRRAERLRNREARRIHWQDLGRADPPPDAPGSRGVRYNHYADDDGDVWETESSSEETTAHALPGAPPTYAQLSAVPGTPRSGSRVVSTNLPGGPGDTAGGPGQASPGVGEAGQADRGSVFGLFETSNPGAARTSTGGDDDEAPPDYETLFTPPEDTTVEPPAYTSLQFQRVSVRPHTPGRAELIHQLRQLRVRRCELIYQQGQLRITDTLFTDTDMTLYARSMRSVQGHLHTWYMTAGTCSGEKTVNLMKHNHPLRTDPLYPGCICADTKRKLIAYTTSDSIVLAKPCGKVKDVIKNSHDKKHEFRQLSGIDYCYSADLYVVTDVSLHRVLLVKPKTRKVYKTFGEHGTGAAQFDNPTLVRCSTHNDIVTLVVLDVGNNAVKLFNTEGQPLHTWGQCAQPEGRLLEPSGLCVGRRGEVYVAEAGRRRVVMYWTERGQHCAQTLMRGGDLAGEHPLSISYVPGADCDKLVIVTSETYPPTAADFNKLNIFKIKQGESPSLEGVTDD